jgi:hypothetical protein
METDTGKVGVKDENQEWIDVPKRGQSSAHPELVTSGNSISSRDDCELGRLTGWPVPWGGNPILAGRMMDRGQTRYKRIRAFDCLEVTGRLLPVTGALTKQEWACTAHFSQGHLDGVFHVLADGEGSRCDRVRRAVKASGNE